MKTKHITEERKTRRSLHERQGYDPLQAVWKQSRAFNTSWFKDGKSLSLTQRMGYTVISLAFVGAALYLFADSAKGFRDGDSTFWLSGIGSIFFLSLGTLGLRNVLRFRRG
jgi:hypothetical protein